MSQCFQFLSWFPAISPTWDIGSAIGAFFAAFLGFFLANYNNKNLIKKQAALEIAQSASALHVELSIAKAMLEKMKIGCGHMQDKADGKIFLIPIHTGGLATLSAKAALLGLNAGHLFADFVGRYFALIYAYEQIPDLSASDRKRFATSIAGQIPSIQEQIEKLEVVLSSILNSGEPYAKEIG